MFLLAGTATAVWTALVPFVSLRLHVDDARLGLLLLCLGLGSLVAMPFAGPLTGRFGCRTVIVSAALLLCASLAPLALAPGFAATALALALFGAAFGSVDVAMNVQAILVERAAGTPMMSGFHGLYSAGGLLGAVCIGVLLLSGLSRPQAVGLMDLLLLALLALAAPGLLPNGDPAPGQPLFVLPRGRVILIGLLCAACFLAEGAIVDWSGLFLVRADRLPPSRAWLGFAAFSAAMTLGRFCGDRLVRRLGTASVLVGGAVLASAGLALAALCPGWPGAALGFTLAGAGAANLVPLLFAAAGREAGPDARPGAHMPPGLAVAAVGTLGYAGILVGPALLGAVSRWAGLPAVFLLVAALLLLVPLLVPFLGRATMPPR